MDSTEKQVPEKKSDAVRTECRPAFKNIRRRASATENGDIKMVRQSACKSQVSRCGWTIETPTYTYSDRRHAPVAIHRAWRCA